MTAFDVAFMSVASVLGVGLIAPQTWSIVRTHNAAGVSVTGLVCSCISYAGWIAFALHLADVAMLVSLLFPFVLEAITLGLAIKWYGETTGIGSAVVWLTALLVAGLVGWSALGGLLALSIVWGYGPAVVEAWRAADVSGVSVLAWRMRAIDGLVWAAYGIGAAQIESLAYGTAAATLAAAVLVGLHPSRRPRISVDLNALTTIPPAEKLSRGAVVPTVGRARHPGCR